MSSAFYPQGMNSWNNRLPQGGYKTWKGSGLYSNPVTNTATHIRPLTNNDPGNVFPTGFGLPRPIKHYRKGIVIPVPVPVLVEDPLNPGQYIEQSLIDYNVNRAVKSSIGSSLGGGNGGTGLISQLNDMPGSFIVKDNQLINSNQYDGIGILNSDTGLPDTNKIDNECTTCQGVGGVSSWYPINNLTEKPQPNVTNPLLCCNQQRKARKRVLGANTNVKKNYYQTTDMYLYNRCQTFQQRQFNFIRGPIDQTILDLFLKYPNVTAKILEYSKPGDPLSIVNYYVAQCNPNFTIETAVEIAVINQLSQSLLAAGYISQPVYLSLLNSTSVQQFITELQAILTPDQYKLVIEYLYQLAADPYNGSVVSGPSNPKGCAQVFYKPNNPQFAQQGGVSSSTRILKLNVDTISTAAAGVRKLKGASASGIAAQIAGGQTPNTPFIYKFKAPTCQASTFSGNPFFFQGQHQNKKICSKPTGEGTTYVSINQHSAGNYIGATQP
jgi:hypothetical protein